MKRYHFQRLSETNSPIVRELNEAASRVIASGQYLLGGETDRFERLLADSLQMDHAVGTANGLEAIRLIFRALIEDGRISPGDKVLVPANTFIASMLPLTQLGLKPQPVDPDPDTMSVNMSAFAKAADRSTKAVLAVHLYGFPAYDHEGYELLRQRGMIIVEDNAQAIGAEIFDQSRGNWRPTGSLGDASAISFYPAKNIGALGDAGAALCADSRLAGIIRELANYGGSRKYHYDYLGYNSRIDEIQAAMLCVKIPHTKDERDRRETTALAYDRGITNPLITKPPRDSKFRQAWHQYVVRTDRRDEFSEYLAANGVETMIHYPVPPHRQRCYAGILTGNYPVADRLASEVLSLPIANTSADEANEISQIINRFK